MRLPESNIKAAIQHPEEEVRLTALRYFTESCTDDSTVMPLVIQAIPTYGCEAAFRMLRVADELPQTEATVTWLIRELHRSDLDPRDIHHDNYCFAIALILCNLAPNQIADWHAEIGDAPLFPEGLRKRLADAKRASAWDRPAAWARFLLCLEELGRKTSWSRSDDRRVHWLGEVLGRYPEAQRKILGLLQRKWPDIAPDFAAWIDQDVVRIAGLLRLEDAIPHIIERAHLAEENTADNCGMALGRIGTEAVIAAIVNDWECGDQQFRFIMCEALKMIHSDQSGDACLGFLNDELDEEIQVELGYALLSHFRMDAMEPVHQLVQGDDDDLFPEQRGLRIMLVATAMIMDLRFPEFEAWYQQAVATNWGSYGLEVSRVSENIGE